MGAWELINRKLLKKTFIHECPNGTVMIITKNLNRATLGTTTVKSLFSKESLENIVSVLIAEGVLFKTGFKPVRKKKSKEDK